MALFLLDRRVGAIYYGVENVARTRPRPIFMTEDGLYIDYLDPVPYDPLVYFGVKQQRLVFVTLECLNEDHDLAPLICWPAFLFVSVAKITELIESA